MKAQSVLLRGWRYSRDDNTFEFTVFNKSAKAYRMMSSMYALSSEKTLMDLLRIIIPLQPGINSLIG